jgi:hypothetical protein
VIERSLVSREEPVNHSPVGLGIALMEFHQICSQAIVREREHIVERNAVFIPRISRHGLSAQNRSRQIASVGFVFEARDAFPDRGPRIVVACWSEKDARQDSDSQRDNHDPGHWLRSLVLHRRISP